jgi:hypothetical protein
MNDEIELSLYIVYASTRTCFIEVSFYLYFPLVEQRSSYLVECC